LHKARKRFPEDLPELKQLMEKEPTARGGELRGQIRVSENHKRNGEDTRTT